MKHLVVSVVSFLMSGLTLFSGFGLGTVLTPTFALFFPVPVAVAATAVVHLANSCFKLVLVGRYADWRIVVRFSVPAAIAALAGASLLSFVASLPTLATYRLGDREFQVTPVKVGEIAGVVVAAIGSAFLGAWVGARMLEQVTLRAVRVTVATMLIVVGFGLVAGII